MVPYPAREEQLAVAARDEQREEGERRRRLAREARHEHVRLEVMHGGKRLVVGERQPLGLLAPDTQANLQPRPDGHRHSVHLFH
eukprot:scaffold192220_cov28-Tisochrysis_lutea.AAC.2